MTPFCPHCADARLQGSKTKMSSSVDSSAIFVTDTPDKIKKKVPYPALLGVIPLAAPAPCCGHWLRILCCYEITICAASDGLWAQINRHAFSGGQATKELQEELGANLDVSAERRVSLTTVICPVLAPV